MRILEVRRHTMRRKPGAHLSQDGIALARLVGAQCAPFDLVITSTIPRAIETAIAMGFEVNKTDAAFGQLPQQIFDAIGWPGSVADIGQVVARGGPCGAFAAMLAAQWRAIVEGISDGQRALLITHGGFVELGAAASLPEADHAVLGGAAGYCEGVRLSYLGDQVEGEALRVPDGCQLIEN